MSGVLGEVELGAGSGAGGKLADECNWADVWLEVSSERENLFGWFKAFPREHCYYDPELMVRVIGNEQARQEQEKCRRLMHLRSGNGS